MDAVPLWAFFLATTAIALIALETGYQFGRWRHARAKVEKETPVNAIVASILGLLGIMMAFSFNLAASRFEARRQAVLEESNAIGTTWLRSRLLPTPHDAETSQYLKEYVDLRVQPVDYSNLGFIVTESERLQGKLWSQGVTAANKAPGSITTGLFLQSLNEVIDLHSKRLFVGLQSRLPGTVWIALFSLVIVGMVSVGYLAGLTATRRTPTEVLLAVSFAIVLYLIVDLDRAHEGLLKVSQQSLIDLHRTMHSADSSSVR